MLDFNPSFKLYLVTRSPERLPRPSSLLRLQVVNFGLTEPGLQEQLIERVVRLERPELEGSLERLAREIVDDQAQIARIQREILNKLIGSSDLEILDDDELIRYLKSSKETSERIQRAIAENERAVVELQLQRNFYKGLAERGSIMYFAIKDMASIQALYQISLEIFSDSFLNVIKEEPVSLENLDKRLLILIHKTTSKLVKETARGLFENDRDIF